MSDALTTAQLADRWGLNKLTVRNWRGLGKGPKFVKLHKGRNAPVVYRLKDVEAYEAKHLVTTQEK